MTETRHTKEVVPTEPAGSSQPRLLDALGISAEDEQVYRALLRRPRATVATLSGLTGRSVASLRRALPRLEQLGLVSRMAGQPPRLVPTRPDVAVEALVSRRQEELAHARLSAQTLLADLPASEYHQPDELVEIVLGRQAVAQRFLQLQQGAAREVMVLDRPPYAQDPDEQNPAEPDVLGRGVRVRAIYARESLEIPGALTLTMEAVAAGEEARVATYVPTKLAIADRNFAILPLTPDQSEMVESALIVHASTLLDALVGLFEMLWRDAVPMPRHATRDTPGTGGRGVGSDDSGSEDSGFEGTGYDGARSDSTGPDGKGSGLVASTAAGTGAGTDDRSRTRSGGGDGASDGEPNGGGTSGDTEDGGGAAEVTRDLLATDAGWTTGRSSPDPQLVALLTAGLKDEAIARQLGVSLRTVHRRTSRIMAELGARTRFQAGMHAARRGWLDPGRTHGERR